jgi:hypothetical protein
LQIPNGRPTHCSAYRCDCKESFDINKDYCFEGQNIPPVVRYAKNLECINAQFMQTPEDFTIYRGKLKHE